MLELRLLGPVGASVDGASVRLPSPHQRALLARLGLAEGAPVRVDHLITDLWGELPPRSARNAVQVLVSGLRSALGRGAVLTDGPAYRLQEGSIVDATVFRAGVRQGLAASARRDAAGALRLLEEALVLWRSTPLDGCDDVPFVEAERAALEELYLAAAEGHAAARLALGDPTGAAADLSMLVAEHPHHEGLLANLVLALGAAGRQVDALAVFERARTRLVEQFGVEPSVQLRAAQERVLRGDLPAQRSPRPAPLRMGLPELPPPLLGREPETAVLEGCAADPAVRLVSVLGLPGVGKTRLAESLVEAHADRAALVSLATVDRGEDVAHAITRRLGIDCGHEDPSTVLLDRFSDDGRRLLLVLDGTEHVAGIGERIERMLRALPRLTVVAASRTPLRLPVEHRLRLEGLAVRDDHGSPGPAPALLLEHVRRMDAGVRLSVAEVDDAVAIAELCGGLPLALELAAHRAAVLGLAEVRRQLEWSLEVLTGPHGQVGRRASITEALLSTVEALPPETARTLHAFATVPEPITPAAARGMVGVDPPTMAEHVEELLDHGLLVRSSASGSHRFAPAPIVRRLFAPVLREPVGAR